MGKIIAIANQKGGVGKTTTAINLSSALGSLGRSVLLVDLDSQGNASRGLGIDALSLPQTIFDVLLGDIDTSLAIRKTGEKGLDILPSNLKLANLDLAIQSKNVSKPFFLLRNALSKVKDQYDYILIDCPPSLGLLNINAFAAASSVLIPVQCEFFAMEGVAAILSSINKIQNDFNPSLKIEGFLLTMYDSRNSLDTEIARQVRGLFKENTFGTVIPRNISIPESSARGMSVLLFRPNSQGAVSYLGLAKEMIDNER